MYWMEMSYRREHMTMRQRLYVEPEELDEYSDDQFWLDVMTNDVLSIGRIEVK